MKTLSAFTAGGWDFTNESVNGTNDFWQMCVNGMDYPRLWYEFYACDVVCGDGVDLIDYA